MNDNGTFLILTSSPAYKESGLTKADNIIRSANGPDVVDMLVAAYLHNVGFRELLDAAIRKAKEIEKA